MNVRNLQNILARVKARTLSFKALRSEAVQEGVTNYSNGWKALQENLQLAIDTLMLPANQVSEHPQFKTQASICTQLYTYFMSNPTGTLLRLNRHTDLMSMLDGGVWVPISLTTDLMWYPYYKQFTDVEAHNLQSVAPADQEAKPQRVLNRVDTNIYTYFVSLLTGNIIKRSNVVSGLIYFLDEHSQWIESCNQNSALSHPHYKEFTPAEAQSLLVKPHPFKTEFDALPYMPLIEVALAGEDTLLVVFEALDEGMRFSFDSDGFPASFDGAVKSIDENHFIMPYSEADTLHQLFELIYSNVEEGYILPNNLGETLC